MTFISLWSPAANSSPLTVASLSRSTCWPTTRSPLPPLPPLIASSTRPSRRVSRRVNSPSPRVSLQVASLIYLFFPVYGRCFQCKRPAFLRRSRVALVGEMLCFDRVANASSIGPSGPVKLARKESVAKPAAKVCFFLPSPFLKIFFWFYGFIFLTSE